MKSGMVWTALSGLVILSMLLLACAPAAAPTPRLATPTPVPAPTASPAAAPGPTPTPALPQAKPAPTVAPSFPPPPAAKPAEEKPRYGVVLTMVQKEDAAHFDTHQMLTIHISHWVDASYSTLIQHDPRDDAKLIPDLAERWEISPDGKVFTFYLRKGVKFHDGKPATSADVKLSMERLAWPPKGILSHPQAMFAGLDKVETPDDYTVKLYLQYPKASFLELLAAPFTAIYPKHVVEQKGDMKRDIVGTGPFKFKSYTRGVVFEQEKFADYFVPGRPYMDGIKRYVIKDSAAIFAALRTGQVLFAGLRQHAVTSREQEILKKEVPGVAIQFVAVPNGTNLGMNLKRKPWDDVRVRKAASLAIDRRVGIQLLREGAAELGGYMPPGQWGIPEEELVKMPGYRADRQGEIAEAKKLLAEAGFPNGFKSKILTRNYKDYIDAAVFAKDQLAKVGIDLSVEARETASAKELLVTKNYDTYIEALASAAGDPDEIFGVYLVTQGGFNVVSFSDPKVDELFDKQSRAMDNSERRKLVIEMQKVAMESVPQIIFFWRRDHSIHGPQVKNYVQAHSLYLNLKFQDVWLAQ